MQANLAPYAKNPCDHLSLSLPALLDHEASSSGGDGGGGGGGGGGVVCLGSGSQFDPHSQRPPILHLLVLGEVNACFPLVRKCTRAKNAP